MIRRIAKRILPAKIKALVYTLLRVLGALMPLTKRHCNICNYHGYFSGFGSPLRLDAQCPNCLSLERHRLSMLAAETGDVRQLMDESSNVLHFAPKPILEKIFRSRCSTYVTADLYNPADVS
jgi:hypothetical protein